MPGLRDAIGVAVWRIHPQTVRPADPCWLSPASLLRPSVLLHALALPKVHFQRTVSTTDWAPILSQGGSVRSPGARGGNRVGRQPRARILARATGVSRQTIRKVLRDQRHGTFRTRQSSLDARSVTLEAAWSGCCRIGAELWRRLKAVGFGGSLRVVSEWATRRRRDETIGHPGGAGFSARTFARSMTTERDTGSAQTALINAVIERAVPALIKAREAHHHFHAMMRSMDRERLDPWIAMATGTKHAAFAAGVGADQDAVAAAISPPQSRRRGPAVGTKVASTASSSSSARCAAAP